ncbi:MAG: hypothetical protein IJ728_08680 [Selenomonadaceae bacterium]|nr:hypothetical protein [Selenomonadaceae bacterium]
MTDKKIESKNKKIDLKCALCGKNLDEKSALIHKNQQGQKEIICYDCFEKETGVDYKTFAYRRESAKQIFFATIFCIIATIYAFIEKGPLYGVAGIIITILIFWFGGKIK